MHISVATANLYFRPFEQTLEIIAESGLKQIEMALYWERKEWAMAQHLQGISARETCRLIEQAGLTVSSIHDGGGVLERADSTDGFVNPQLDRVLDCLGYAPGCIVFHTPHVEGELDGHWFDALGERIAQAAQAYQTSSTFVTLENVPPFAGYGVPLLTPRELADFAAAHGLHVTLDTTHYGQMSTDLVPAATALRDQIRTVHLSDYAAGESHLFVGDGDMDLPGCLKVLDRQSLHAVTLECALARRGEDARTLAPAAVIDRLNMARTRVEKWLDPATWP